MQVRNNGFTLVELSIVLVIIGLLIGGILVAQSMVETAKLNRAITQIQQFDIAVTNFRDKYKQLPGDSTLFYDPGNNNGYLLNQNTTLNFIVNDNQSFWIQLQQGTGFTQDGKTFGVQGLGNFSLKGSTPHSPAVKLDIVSAVIPGSCGAGGGFYNCGLGNGLGHAYMFADWEGIGPYPTSIPAGRPVLKVNTLSAIDAKIDDRMPYTGAVQNRIRYEQGDLYTAGCGNYNGTTWSNGTNNATATYQAQNSGVICYMSVRMFSQTEGQ